MKRQTPSSFGLSTTDAPLMFEKEPSCPSKRSEKPARRPADAGPHRSRRHRNILIGKGTNMPDQPPFQNPEQADENASLTFDAPPEAVASSDDPVWHAHGEISRFLERSTEKFATAEATSFAAEDLTGPGNLVGVGVGTAAPTSLAWTAEPGAPTLRVYLLEPMDESQLREMLRSELQLSEVTSPEVPVEPVVTGEIRARPHTFRHRPAPGGISVGHVGITAGTLGCLARGRSSERRERRLILSNNHVLADTNAGSFGDVIVQPGPTDGGRASTDQIAALERFVPISFTQSNHVDCATAWADPDLVRPEIVYLDKGATRFFRLGSTPRAAKVGDLVGKSGRTTQLTSGRVANVSATIKVRFGSRVALFRDQIEILPLNAASGPFSSGGDSGSIIWTLDEARLPVGLLFAGGGSSTFANHMETVLKALDIELVT